MTSLKKTTSFSVYTPSLATTNINSKHRNLHRRDSSTKRSIISTKTQQTRKKVGVKKQPTKKKENVYCVPNPSGRKDGISMINNERTWIQYMKSREKCFEKYYEENSYKKEEVALPENEISCDRKESNVLCYLKFKEEKNDDVRLEIYRDKYDTLIAENASVYSWQPDQDDYNDNIINVRRIDEEANNICVDQLDLTDHPLSVVLVTEKEHLFYKIIQVDKDEENKVTLYVFTDKDKREFWNEITNDKISTNESVISKEMKSDNIETALENFEECDIEKLCLSEISYDILENQTVRKELKRFKSIIPKIEKKVETPRCSSCSRSSKSNIEKMKSSNSSYNMLKKDLYFCPLENLKYQEFELSDVDDNILPQNKVICRFFDLSENVIKETEGLGVESTSLNKNDEVKKYRSMIVLSFSESVDIKNMLENLKSVNVLRKTYCPKCNNSIDKSKTINFTVTQSNTNLAHFETLCDLWEDKNDAAIDNGEQPPISDDKVIVTKEEIQPSALPVNNVDDAVICESTLATGNSKDDSHPDAIPKKDVKYEPLDFNYDFVSCEDETIVSNENIKKCYISQCFQIRVSKEEFISKLANDEHFPKTKSNNEEQIMNKSPPEPVLKNLDHKEEVFNRSITETPKRRFQEKQRFSAKRNDSKLSEIAKGCPDISANRSKSVETNLDGSTTLTNNNKRIRSNSANRKLCTLDKNQSGGVDGKTPRRPRMKRTLKNNTKIPYDPLLDVNSIKNIIERDRKMSENVASSRFSIGNLGGGEMNLNLSNAENSQCKQTEKLDDIYCKGDFNIFEKNQPTKPRRFTNNQKCAVSNTRENVTTTKQSLLKGGNKYNLPPSHSNMPGVRTYPRNRMPDVSIAESKARSKISYVPKIVDVKRKNDGSLDYYADIVKVSKIKKLDPKLNIGRKIK